MKVFVGLCLAVLLIAIEPAFFYVFLLLAMLAATMYGIVAAVRGE